MIAAFLQSWGLFQHTYLAGWCIAALLAMVGVIVVARDQIFLGAAVSQASMLGIALGMWAGRFGGAECQWCESEWLLAVCGSSFAILGALLTAGGMRHGGGESHEAITGWVFLLSSSLAVLVLSHSPHGLEEVHRLLSSTIIGAGSEDVVIFALLLSVTVLFTAVARDRLVLLITDPEMAGAVGIRVDWWNRLLSVWLGITVGLSIRVSGILYTFGCLVLPALIAKNVCRNVRSLFIVAPICALGASALAFVYANARDFPPGQVAAVLLSIGLAGAWSFRGRG